MCKIKKTVAVFLLASALNITGAACVMAAPVINCKGVESLPQQATTLDCSKLATDLKQQSIDYLKPQEPPMLPVQNYAYRLKEGLHNLIIRASRLFGISPSLLSALAVVESGGNQSAVSPAGAVGVMQLMPETARHLGVNPYDIEQNVYGGAKYLRQQLEQFGGDTSKALAAYNAGPEAVKKYGGVPPYRETQEFVRMVLLLSSVWRY